MNHYLYKIYCQVKQRCFLFFFAELWDNIPNLGRQHVIPFKSKGCSVSTNILSCFLWSLCCLQARANRGWSTSASTSAFPATSACPCASTTYQSDCVFASSPSSKRSGKVVFLGPPPHKKKKNNTRTKTSFDCFLCAIHLPVNQWSSQPSQSISILPREKRWRQAVTVIAKAHSSLSSCVIPSLVAHFRDYRRKIPFFFFGMCL